MIKPLGDRVVIRVHDEQSKTTSSGIYVPTKTISQKGTVVAVGSGRMLETGETAPLEVSVGDVVMFEKHSGAQIEHETEKLLVMYEGDIMAIL